MKESQASGSKPMTGEKASAKMATTEDSDVITSYMVKTSSKDENAAVPVVEVPRKRKDEAESSAKGKAPEGKKNRTKTKLRAIRTVDQDIVSLFKTLPVPLELVVRHGASFETQAKKAIKQVYANGKEYRKRVNPILNASAGLSHALMVKGWVAGIPCDRLIIDPGNSVSMDDVNTPRKGPIPIVRESKLTFQLADGSMGAPVGETKSRQVINVEGVEVKLRMPVIDSQGTYDVLLGRDWLHAVDAVARYSKNQYKISRKGKSATLQGQLYTQKEVQLPASSSSDEGEEAEESETSSSTTDEEDDGMIKAYMTSAIDLEQFAMKPVTTEPLLVKRLSPDAEIPQRMSEESAGYDLYASACVVVPPWNQALVPTDIAIDIPSGHFGLIKPRSGLALREKV
ncbi:MAG: hypothetical protein E6J34_24045, partial [Chloroflexi bacterium]